MPRLKNRNETPPYSWQYFQPQISPATPVTGYSLRDLALKVQQLRLGNPGITAQYNLSTDINVIENEVDEQNAQRCLSHGWSAFVEDSVGPPQPVFHQPQRLPRVAAAATSVKRGATVGVAMIRDLWLGDSLRPVKPELSENRAQVCVKCPRNDGDKSFLDKLTTEAANTVRALLQAKYDIDVKTSVDDKLGMCRACGCVLPLKVHVSLDVAKKRLKPEEFVQLHETCWIRHEVT